jgi:hypothetical protein
MAVFEFTVNDSFLDGPGHPITVPKNQYPALTAAELDHKDIVVILPHGERFEAAIYHGEAGYGEYYQLRFHGSNRTLPSYLKLHDHLIVVLTKVASRSYALVEFRG